MNAFQGPAAPESGIIPVICDRCRQTGLAGDSDFSHLGDLLDFEPVPRKKERVDGWTAERQRAFIAALSATGSKRQAARAVGMAAYGVDQLLKSDGSDGFKTAFDRAMAIAAQNGSMKIALGVADAAARNAQMTPPSRLRGLPALAEPEITMSEDQRWDLVHSIGTKFMRKVAAERQARLNGEIVAADFYLRQITFMEVLLDLGASSLGFDPKEALHELRRGDHGPLDIAATSLSDWLDDARRLWWAREGEPERPPHPDSAFLIHHRSADGDYTTQASQGQYGAMTTPARGYNQEEWAAMSHAEQVVARNAQKQEDAEEQRDWERRAHEEWAARQASPSPPAREGRGEGGEGEGGEENE